MSKGLIDCNSHRSVQNTFPTCSDQVDPHGGLYQAFKIHANKKIKSKVSNLQNRASYSDLNFIICVLPITTLNIFQSHIHNLQYAKLLICMCSLSCQYHNLVSLLMDGEALKSRYCIPCSTIDHCGWRAPCTSMRALACVCLCLYLSRAAVNLGRTVGHHSICLMLSVAKQHIQQH